MENASKALLIAGAILLVIALIAIGMLILGQGNKVVNDVGVQVEGMSVQAHNNIVQQYIGNRIGASSVISLITAVTSYNNSAGALHQIVLTDTTDINAVTNMAQTYTVTVTGTEADGAINEVSIVAN